MWREGRRIARSRIFGTQWRSLAVTRAGACADGFCQRFFLPKCRWSSPEKGFVRHFFVIRRSVTMSQRGGRPIDFQAWAQNQIVKRAVAALEARDEAFAERNADTPLPQLARYLSRCAISLGHTHPPAKWMAVHLLSSVLAAGQPRWRRQGCRSRVPCASCATPLAIRRKR